MMIDHNDIQLHQYQHKAQGPGSVDRPRGCGETVSVQKQMSASVGGVSQQQQRQHDNFSYSDGGRGR